MENFYHTWPFHRCLIGNYVTIFKTTFLREKRLDSSLFVTIRLPVMLEKYCLLAICSEIINVINFTCPSACLNHSNRDWKKLTYSKRQLWCCLLGGIVLKITLSLKVRCGAWLESHHWPARTLPWRISGIVVGGSNYKSGKKWPSN